MSGDEQTTQLWSLPEAVWRVATVTRTGWQGQELAPDRPRAVVTAHAVRGGHTLCGVSTQAITWDDNITDAGRCTICAAVPDGHATANDMIDLGITYRRLDYWTRVGYLLADNPDCGSGTRRTYPPGEYTAVQVIARLVNAGLTPQAAAKATRHDGELAAGVRVLIDAPDAGLVAAQ